MKPECRRMLTMASVIGAGTVLILFDTPPILLITGTVALGFLMLILTGSLRLSEKESGGRKGRVEEKKEIIREQPGGKKIETVPLPEIGSEKVKKRSIRKLFSSLARMVKKEKALPKPDQKVKKIDEMLDTLIAESPVPAQVTPVPNTPSPKAAAPPLGLAPLKELTTAQLEDDLLTPEGMEGDRDSPLDLGPSVSIPPDLSKETDEVEDTLKVHEGDLADLDSLGEMDLSMDSLGGIDL
ncbi:MAG: hypothetical protein LUO93_05675, partial [Methanomicrobiales archaeon]|nr:hypothetical protein [Methanomicrobiales archaeon]